MTQGVANRMPESKLLLVDGHSFAYRAFYAIQRLSNAKGQPTNAVFGFAKMVRKLMQEHHPTHCAIVMDLGEPVKRLEKLGTYKAHRKPMPDDLKTQIPMIREFVQSSQISLLEKDGVEADDIIATVALQAKREGIPVAIATSDKDFMQLVDDTICLLNPAARETPRVDAAAVQARYLVAPGQIIDFLSLQGDAVDNIPGIPGVGEKTAASLLQKFGSLANLYQQLDQVSDVKLRQKLLDHRERVELNRELVRLDSAIPLDRSPGDLKVQPPDYPKLIALLERLEFRSLTEEVRRESQKNANPEFSLGV